MVVLGLGDLVTRPSTLGWMLQGFPVRKLAQVAGLDAADADDLERFRAELARKVAELAQP